MVVIALFAGLVGCLQVRCCLRGLFCLLCVYYMIRIVLCNCGFMLFVCFAIGLLVGIRF